MSQSRTVNICISRSRLANGGRVRRRRAPWREAGAGRRRRRHVREHGRAQAPGHDQPVRTDGRLCGRPGEAVAAGGPLAVRGRRPGLGRARGAGCPSRVAALAVGRVRAGVDTCRGALRRGRARALGPGVQAAARPGVRAPARTRGVRVRPSGAAATTRPPETPPARGGREGRPALAGSGIPAPHNPQIPQAIGFRGPPFLFGNGQGGAALRPRRTVGSAAGRRTPVAWAELGPRRPRLGSPEPAGGASGVCGSEGLRARWAARRRVSTYLCICIYARATLRVGMLASVCVNTQSSPRRGCGLCALRVRTGHRFADGTQACAHMGVQVVCQSPIRQLRV